MLGDAKNFHEALLLGEAHYTALANARKMTAEPIY